MEQFTEILSNWQVFRNMSGLKKLNNGNFIAEIKDATF